jgi:hypothetical protein
LTQTATVAETDFGHLVRLLAIGHLALVVATFPLWIHQGSFPQVPLISIAGHVPEFIEWGLLGGLLASLGAMLLVLTPSPRRMACLLMGISTFILACIDQHRLQPWAWQFIILSVVLASADDLTAKTCWRWLVISIYAWSAWSKMDHGFFVGHGRFLLDGFCKATGFIQESEFWPVSVRNTATVAIPTFELLIAFGLAWHRTRGFALIGSMIMHGALLLALGPFGHGHKPGVLIWNVFFIVQNGLLFRRPRVLRPVALPRPPSKVVRIGNSFARFAVFAAMLWPSMETFGLCDHWPAWAVYAAKLERVTLFVHSEEFTKLFGGKGGDTLKLYLGPQAMPDDWHPFRIDRWSLDTVFAPIYPQDRFQVGVALSLTRECKLDQIRVVIEGPANRWTGKRTIHEYIGLESLNRLAETFRCNAQPRSGQIWEH